MSTTSIHESLPLWRLHALRALYGLVAVAMGAQVWPLILAHDGDWSFNAGVVKAMLGSLTLLSLLGIRYPLRMLPLLFWEMAWKTIWLVSVALPAWIGGRLEGDVGRSAFACALVVVVYALVPWGYVSRKFALESGDRWSPPRDTANLPT